MSLTKFEKVAHMDAGLTKRLPGLAGTLVTATLLSLALAGCGGGGGSAGTVGAGGTSGTGTGTGGGTVIPPVIAAAVLSLTIVDGSAAPITTLSGGQSGTVKAKFTDGAGAVLANAVIKFKASDATLVQFTPASGSALTDATGTAVINVKPADFTSAGALTLTADAASGTNNATAAVNIGIGAAPLTVGTLSFSPTPAGPLPAFSVTTLNVPVTSNGQPVNTAPGLTLTSLCQGDQKATLVPGAITAGVVAVAYTNQGCIRTTDDITVSIGNSSKTIKLDVSSANIATIGFISSDLSGTSSLVLKGTGGVGRQESAKLTFRVLDQSGSGLSGVPVNFVATTSTGGLQVSPAQATTDSNGNVTTSVLSGTIPTPVRVIAQAVRNGTTISGISDALTISTGFPIQKAMSMSVDKYNIEGLDYDGVPAQITVRLADQYGNPISDNTTINFVSEGGAVGSSLQGACQTSNGGCTVPLISQNFKPANGRVTVLAYAQGIEDFVDSNGDGQYSCTNFTSPAGAAPSSVFRPLIDTCVSGGEPYTPMGDPFLDAGLLGPQTSTGVTSRNGLDGNYEPANGDLPFPFNKSSYSASTNHPWGLNYIRTSSEIIFSGSRPYLTRQFCDTSGCRDWDPVAQGGPADVVNGLAGPGCKAVNLAFRIYDVNNNPLPYQTAVAAGDAVKISTGTFFPATVPSANNVGGTFHQVTLLPESGCASGSVNIVVTTPKGNGIAFPFRSN